MGFVKIFPSFKTLVDDVARAARQERPSGTFYPSGLRIFLACIILTGNFFVSAQVPQTDCELYRDIQASKEIEVDPRQDQPSLNQYCYEVLLCYRKKIIEALNARNMAAIDSLIKPAYLRFSGGAWVDSVSILTISEKEVADLLAFRFADVIAASESHEYTYRRGERSLAWNKTRFYLNSESAFVDDSLEKMLGAELRRNRTDMHDRITAYEMSDEARAFLHAFTDYRAYTFDYCSFSLEGEMQQRAASYLEKFPETRRSAFVREVMNSRFTKHDVGWKISAALGVSFPTDSLSRYFTPSFAIMITGEVMYRDAFLQVNFGRASGQQIRRDLKEPVTWQRSDHSEILIAEGLLGYELYIGNKDKFSPLVGLGALWVRPISPAHDSTRYYQSEPLRSNNLVVAGVSWEHRFSIADCSNAKEKTRVSAYTESFSFIKVSLIYHAPLLGNINAGLRGNYYFLRIGVGFAGFSARKIRTTLLR